MLTGGIEQPIHTRNRQRALLGIPGVDLVRPGPSDGSHIPTRHEEKRSNACSILGRPCCEDRRSGQSRKEERPNDPPDAVAAHVGTKAPGKVADHGDDICTCRDHVALRDAVAGAFFQSLLT